MTRTDPRPNYGPKRRERDDGYVDVYEPIHPLARVDGYVFEHRKMAWDAGLFTDRSLQVHHVNEVRNDNRLENFEIKSGSIHALEHAESRGFATNQYGTFPVKPADERSSAPRPSRPCAGCPGEVPGDLRRDALYCTSACRVRAFKRRQRQAA